MTTNHHTHACTDELAVVCVPWNTDYPVKYEIVKRDIESLKKMVDGWIEIVRTEFMPELACGCRLVMVVDEEGALKRDRAENPRANVFYPFGTIYGDAVILGEGPVTGGEIDFVSLPPTFHEWEGPGAPIPSTIPK